MKILLHRFIQVLICVLLSLSGSRVDGVEYYVKPTTACPDISTHCPVDRTCLDLDTYISNSSIYFSPDNVNISLYFLCGVHNQTLEKHINIQDLHSFVMLGISSDETVTIHMPLQHSRTLQAYTFTNVSNVTIANVTIISLSIAVKGKTTMFTVKNADFYGHGSESMASIFKVIRGISKSISFIILNETNAFFENCTFEQNEFIRLYSGSTLLIKNCSFKSYFNDEHSAIFVDNSTICLSERAYFFDNHVIAEHSSGAAIYLQHQSILNINKGAHVNFTKNTAATLGGGGAIHAHAYSFINVFSKAVINFIGNCADTGGAVHLFNHSAMYMSNNSIVNFSNNNANKGGAIIMLIFATMMLENAIVSFSNNTAGDGGAIFLRDLCNVSTDNGSLYFVNNNGDRGGACFVDYMSRFSIKNHATVIFLNSAAKYSGGALYVVQSHIYIKNAILMFETNSVKSGDGGAVQMTYNSFFHINQHAQVQFISNNATFHGGALYLLSSYIETLNHSVLMFKTNSAMQGGALYLSSVWSFSIGYTNVSIIFKNNLATKDGGALYANLPQNLPCFLAVRAQIKHSKVEFDSNVAGSGIGMHIYGGSIRSYLCTLFSLWYSMPYCGEYSPSVNITLFPNSNRSLSKVSSDPVRVCLCDANGKPQCANLSKILVKNVTAIPGEAMNISLVVVGQDFGATKGSVYANSVNLNSKIHHHDNGSKYQQWYLKSAVCSTIHYTVNHSTESEEHMFVSLHTSSSPLKEVSWNETAMKESISEYTQANGCIYPNLLTTPVYFNITMLRCPKGFTLKQQQCQCFSVLINNQFNCFLLKNKGYLHWNSLAWVGNAESDTQRNSSEIWFSQFCPSSNCKTDWKTVELESDPDGQCAFNRAGLLCGGCKENFSLAIGSSRCINCTSNSYLALFIFFVFAGPLLVIFIFSLNLTVSQGLINGIVFYANTVWDYKLMLTYSKTILLPFQIFIAWLNLDFGVETCLFVGLTAFWKTWLQFLFPLYIWAIAGLIILICRHSTRATNLIGDRAVPLLATLFYLSYMKVLRTVVSAFNLRILTTYPSGSSMPVWYLGGNLPYFKPPHVYLFAASVAASVLFCIPFTLFLLLVRWLRKISHLRPLRWVNKFTPIYDACFASLHNNHHQLFGILLLIRGVLLIILTINSVTSNPRTMNLLILFIVTLLLLLNVTFSKKVFRSFVVKILECVSILNLSLLSFLALYSPHNEIIIMEVSIGFAFFQFCVIIVLSFWRTYRNRKNCCKRFEERHQEADDAVDEMYHERVEDSEVNELLIIPERGTTGTY